MCASVLLKLKVFTVTSSNGHFHKHTALQNKVPFSFDRQHLSYGDCVEVRVL